MIGTRTPLILSLFLLFSLSMLLLEAGCARNAMEKPAALPLAVATSHKAPAGTMSSAPDYAYEDYTGDESCASCHASETRLHRHSNHALTLRPMNRVRLGALSPTVGSLPESKCRIQAVGANFRVEVPGQPQNQETLQFALGSGKVGMTFIKIMEPVSLFEMRASYFPHLRKWYATPGHGDLAPDDLGKDHDKSDARKCILCHATTLKDDSLTPESRFMGVGCESCHGPGRVHIQAVKSGSADVQMARMGQWSGTQINEACGKCHRTTKDVEAMPLAARSTHRFQPYGLMLSRCFKESRDALSCITCHNPHQNASLDLKSYEAVCLRCHSGQSTNQRTERGEKQSEATLFLGKACPVNPKTKCIGCHMPSRPMLPGFAATAAADHFIRIQRDEAK